MGINLSGNLVYYITKRQNGRVYCVSEVDKDTGVVTWTQRKTMALQFATEAGVYNFVHAFLDNRSDIVLVNSLAEG